MIDEEEPRFDEHLFPDKETKRCKKFRGKRVSVCACIILYSLNTFYCPKTWQ